MSKQTLEYKTERFVGQDEDELWKERIAHLCNISAKDGWRVHTLNETRHPHLTTNISILFEREVN